jgi:hypothetical protein
MKKLSDATEKQLSNIETICGGTELNWPDPDLDFSVPGILEGH